MKGNKLTPQVVRSLSTQGSFCAARLCMASLCDPFPAQCNVSYGEKWMGKAISVFFTMTDPFSYAWLLALQKVMAQYKGGLLSPVLSLFQRTVVCEGRNLVPGFRQLDLN